MKFFLFFLIALAPLSEVAHAMEHNFSEIKHEEGQGVALSLPIPLDSIKEIAAYLTDAKSIKQGYENVITYITALGLRVLLNDGAFIKKFVDTLYEKFITPADRLSDVEKKIYFDKGLTLAASLKSNNYAIERLKTWLITLGNEKKIQKKILTTCAMENIKKNKFKKNSFLIKAIDKNLTVIINTFKAHALRKAIVEDNIETVKHLVQDGIDLEFACEKFDNTPLMMAVIEKHKEIVEYLVAQKANVKAVNRSGRTTLMWAIEKMNSEDDQDMLMYLVEHGVDINAVDNNGNSALMYAAYKGYVSVVIYLVQHNANAVKRGDASIVAILDETAQKQKIQK